MEIETIVVPYARAGERTLHLHVTRPRGHGPWPALLDIHGGAWTHFDPSVNFHWCRGLARRGHVVASIEMRLAPAHRWPAFLCDVRAAARWLRRHGAGLGVDPARPLGAIGGSTGGHLATLLAMWPDEPRHPVTTALDTPDDGPAAVDHAIALWPILDVVGRYRMVVAPPPPHVRPVIARFPPRASAPTAGGATTTRLERLAALRERHPRLGDLAGAAVQRANAWLGDRALPRALLYRTLAIAHEGAFASEAEMEEASPLARARAGLVGARPAIAIIQGDRDPNLTPAMSRAFVDAYVAAGGCATLELVPELGHSFGNVPSAAADALVEGIAAITANASVAAAPPHQQRRHAAGE